MASARPDEAGDAAGFRGGSQDWRPSKEKARGSLSSARTWTTSTREPVAARLPYLRIDPGNEVPGAAFPYIRGFLQQASHAITPIRGPPLSEYEALPSPADGKHITPTRFLRSRLSTRHSEPRRFTERLENFLGSRKTSGKIRSSPRGTRRNSSGRPKWVR